MDSANTLELISKLRQRLLRLIKLGEPNQLNSTTDNCNPIDRTAHVEECVRNLFNTTCLVETFIQDVQQILNVTIKSNLSIFLAETIPLAHQYLQQNQYDPLSWEIFKTIPLQISPSNQTTNITRLPSFQQAHFRLPSSCPQLIDLTSRQEQTFLTPNIRPDANLYQQKLIHRFAQHNFYLNQCGEELILQTLNRFLKYIIQRIHFYTEHRIDTQLLNSSSYEMTSNVREQIRFLIELNKYQNGQLNINVEEQNRLQTRDNRLSILEELRQKEADETACLVLRESRLKRQKTHQKSIPIKILRANLQDLITVMENESILKRSKTLLYAYANR